MFGDKTAADLRKVLAHWHFLCPSKPSSCRVLIEYRKQGFFDTSHSDMHDGGGTPDGNQMTSVMKRPDQLQRELQMYGVPCRDPGCATFMRDHGISI